MPLLQGYPDDPPGVKRRRQELAAAMRELQQAREERGENAQRSMKLTGENADETQVNEARSRLKRLLDALKAKGRPITPKGDDSAKNSDRISSSGRNAENYTGGNSDL